MNTTALLHIALTVGGIVILYTLVQPMYQQTIDITDTTAEVEQALATATQANDELAQLRREYQSISQADINRLQDYLPTDVDELTVLADLLSMANRSNVTISSYESTPTSNDDVEVSYLAEADDKEISQTLSDKSGLSLSLGVTGAYENIKDFLSLTQQNRYPLIIGSLQAGATSGKVDNSTLLVEGQAANTSQVSLQVLVPEYRPQAKNNSTVANPNQSNP